MRKYQQEQILQLVNTLSEAITEMKRLLSQKEPSLVLQLLADCQDCAIQIGNYIEHLEGEGTQTVGCLEEYCNLLYQASLKVMDADIGSEFLKQIQKQLMGIRNTVKNELKPNRIEIAFLPYKASMWDSFESIWLAAKEDPQCDAYVVAIPYYDRFSDGAFGNMHDEGDQYPNYVPIVDWRTYNMEERHPDIIFIHNPYDGENYITSVHPDYYSNQLKAFTDLLVYIPYFVMCDSIPEHFCGCSGVLNADRVIVQTEKIKDTYSRVFRKYQKTNSKSKFIALGSPKFDKVIHTKREDCQIPAEWERLIKKADGTRKKVIFYNTSVDGLLHGNESCLSKLKYVFDRAKTQTDMVLLWRPHPLSDAAYAAMFPNLKNAYLRIIEDYKRQGYGIYDDTADLNRALAISDAYYGDWSSLMTIFGITGKPVMLQDVNIIHVKSVDESRRKLWFDDCVIDGDEIWFSASNFNGLFRADIKTGAATFVGRFPNEHRDVSRLHSSINRFGNKLIFAPSIAENIAVYDMDKNIFIQYPLKEISVKHNPAMKFVTSIVYKNFAFFFSYRYPAIVRLDLDSGEITYYSGWYNQNKKSFSLIDNWSGIFRPPVLIDNMCYLPSRQHNAVFELNMDTLTGDFITVGNSDLQYADMCFDGVDFWLLPIKPDTIIRWNRASGVTKEYAIERIGRYACGILNIQGKLWINNQNGYGLLHIDKKTMDTGVIPIDNNTITSEIDPREFWFCKRHNKEYFMLARGSNKLYKLNKDGVLAVIGDSISYADSVNRCEFQQFLYGYVKPSSSRPQTYADHILYENENINFQDLLMQKIEIDSVSTEQQKCFQALTENSDGSAGRKIYEHIKSDLLGKW